MSYLSEQDIACPYCKHPNTVELWSTINVHEDPELKDILLGGELNMAECESCHRVFYAEQFLLYHDPDNELMAFVYPSENRDDREAWMEKTKTDFQRSQTADNPIPYDPVSLFGLDELVTLVAREEEVSIQGEIVTLLSQQHGFKIKSLKPSIARRQRLPKILPFKEDSRLSARDSVLAALTDLLKINDRLFVYNEAHSLLTEHTDLDVPLAS